MFIVVRINKYIRIQIYEGVEIQVRVIAMG